jgi:hypothetical protein
MILAALSLAIPLKSIAQAQAWPTKPVRIVIGYAPGSGADIEARFVSNYLEQTYKQPFLVPAASSVPTWLPSPRRTATRYSCRRLRQPPSRRW